MSIRKPIAIIALLTVATTAIATLHLPFISWDALIRTSPVIVIARCVAEYDECHYVSQTNGTKVTRIRFVVNCVTSDYEVIRTLKGQHLVGNIKVICGDPNPAKEGQTYLIIADSEKDGNYYAIESYRRIPVSPQFDFRNLDGKRLTRQIRQIILNRLQQLAEDSKDNKEEKKRLEQGLEEFHSD